MNYLSENIRAFRTSLGMTQEDVADAVRVSAQSVSKWERGETCPDIELLPSLAILFRTSIDRLMGMDRITRFSAVSDVFTRAHRHTRAGEYDLAVKTLRDALQVYANDMSILSELAMTLAFTPDGLSESVSLCERVLNGDCPEKIRHTVRAALCVIYEMSGDPDRARRCASQLPHARESREEIRALLESAPSAETLTDSLRLLILGEM